MSDVKTKVVPGEDTVQLDGQKSITIVLETALNLFLQGNDKIMTKQIADKACPIEGSKRIHFVEYTARLEAIRFSLPMIRDHLESHPEMTDLLQRSSLIPINDKGEFSMASGRTVTEGLSVSKGKALDTKIEQGVALTRGKVKSLNDELVRQVHAGEITARDRRQILHRMIEPATEKLPPRLTK